MKGFSEKERNAAIIMAAFFLIGAFLLYIQKQQQRENLKEIELSYIEQDSLFKSRAAEYSPIADSLLIDLNRAEAYDLQKLPGIGPVLAERIMEYRSVNTFISPQQLKNVKGIGEKKLEAILPYITVQK